MYEPTTSKEEQLVSNLLANRGTKHNFQQEMEVDPPQKKQCIGEGATYVQNCVLDVHGPSNSIHGVNPSQLNNMQQNDWNSPDYDAPFPGRDSFFLDEIARYIP